MHAKCITLFDVLFSLVFTVQLFVIVLVLYVELFAMILVLPYLRPGFSTIAHP